MATCSSDVMCDLGFECIGGSCRCLSGYKYNFTSKECHPNSKWFLFNTQIFKLPKIILIF